MYAEWDVPTPAGAVPVQFEERARHAARTREGAQLELIDERPAEKAWPDGTRGRVIQWLTRVMP
ncbi:hypothetical protein GCM10023323_02750 [Streptomyces thinghirensis]|uniref:Uncharacterized protein n=1 Tax=Streptomyces thinghirensis TaxID=551547 RepID=A0ABP9STW4_9ACTN